MECVQCKFKLTKEQNFCPQCGTAVVSALTCPNCKTINDPSHKFCANCGTALQSGFNPIRRLQVNDFEAIKKHVSILFADIKGSTSAISNLDPEDARNILGPVVKQMLSAVYQFNGTVIHTAGDGIVAIFGAPLAYEDHGLRACLAANLMQGLLASSESALKIRVGLNTGEIVMDLIGNSQQHLEYDITGAAVNLAARMEQTAKPGQIQLTRNILALVEEAIEVEPLGAIAVKGFEDPVEVWELKRIKDDSSLISIKYRPSFIPFVGREDIIQRLQQNLALAETGQGNMVSLEAEAGQGKSRIISEFLRHDFAQETQKIFCGGFSHMSNILLFPVIQLFKDLMKISTEDSLETVLEKLRPYIRGSDLPEAEQAALALVNKSQHAKEWEELDAKLKHNYLFSIGLFILRKAASDKTLILVIEDLHWVDYETEQFIDFILPHMANMKIFILGTYRPGFKDRWLNKDNYQQIKVGPIHESHLRLVLDIIFGNHPSLAQLKKDVLHACSGNPFFMQEMINSLEEDNILIGKMGNYHLNAANLAKNIKLPESIFALLQTKIDKLPEAQKKLLQMASVAGERFLYDLIVQLSPSDMLTTRQNLNQLTDLHFVYEVQLYPELEFSFNHALIQEVLYNTLLKSIKNGIHLKILEFLEQFPEKRLAENLELLANHAYLGQNWEKAFQYCSRAAEKTFTVNALTMTLQYSRQAIEAASHIPDQSQIIDALILVYMDMARSYLHLGSPQEQAPLCEKLQSLIPRTSNVTVKCLIWHTNAAYFLGTFESEKAALYLDTAYDLALKEGRGDLQRMIEFLQFVYYCLVGKFEDYKRTSKKFLSNLETLHCYVPAFRLDIGPLGLSAIILNLLFIGNFSEFNKYHQLAKTINLTECTVPSIGLATALGAAMVQQGDFSDQAEKYLTQSISNALEVNMLLVLPVAQSALAILYFYTNRKKEGRELVANAVEVIILMQFYLYAGLSTGLAAEGLLLYEQLDDAEVFIKKGMKMAEKGNFNSIIIWLKRISAEIELKKPAADKTAILQKLLEAMKMAETSGMDIQVAKCHLAIARLYRHFHEDKSAEQEEKTARTMYQQLGISKELWRLGG